MTVGRRQILSSIFSRVAESGLHCDVNFLADEVCRWPEGAVAELIAAGLLKEVERSGTVTCRGCEERCRRPIVFVEPSDGHQHKIALSDCHLYSTMGPFEHLPENLRRWMCHRKMVGRFVGRQLGSSLKDWDERWRRIRYATLRIGDVRRAVSLEFSGAAQLRVGGSVIPLIDVIDWDESDVSVDLHAVYAIGVHSQDTQSGNKRAQASSSVHEDNKLVRQIRNRRLQRRLSELAREHPKKNKEALAKLIEKSREFPGMTWATIARNTHMPTK